MTKKKVTKPQNPQTMTPEQMRHLLKASLWEDGDIDRVVREMFPVDPVSAEPVEPVDEVRLRVSPAEFLAVAKLAKSQGRTLAAMVEDRILDGFRLEQEDLARALGAETTPPASTEN